MFVSEAMLAFMSDMKKSFGAVNYLKRSRRCSEDFWHPVVQVPITKGIGQLISQLKVDARCDGLQIEHHVGDSSLAGSVLIEPAAAR